MNKTKKLLATLFVAFCLAGCDQSLQRAERTVGGMQENMTTIVNELNEVQVLENNLQTDFEQVLGNSSDLSMFNTKDNPVEQNIQKRITHIENMTKAAKGLTDSANELLNLNKGDIVATDQLVVLQQNIQKLNDLLTVYATDYAAYAATESQSFQSIANPDADYTNFFAVMNNINHIAITNHMNLDRVIPTFEPINVQLINLKVQLVKLLEAK